ncbi:MAG: D-hexose-6-phosphate mutarotase, partial [Verrucomicrobiota bacterium]
MNDSKRIVFSEGNGQLPKIEVHTEWSDAEIYLQGAHVTQFQRKNEPALLFTSAESKFQSGQPIRGGVPIIFPWFGASEGKNGMHGFVRNQEWKLSSHQEENGAVVLHFTLPDSPQAAEFPKFSAEYFVTVGKTLGLELKITNQSGEHLLFEDCLHTYFTVGEIAAVGVSGLKG